MRCKHGALAAVALCTGIVAAAILSMGYKASEVMGALQSKGLLLSHDVYFSLKDSNAENRQRLVDACHEYLSGHDGVVFYAAGVLNPDLNREVNDRDFDVALHIVFDGKESHDKYQTHPRHLKFIEENRATWSQVRVFDSDVTVGK